MTVVLKGRAADCASESMEGKEIIVGPLTVVRIATSLASPHTAVPSRQQRGRRLYSADGGGRC